MADSKLNPRHIRYRKFARLRKASNMKAFFTAQATRLTSSASGRTVTANASTDVCSSTAHGFLTGKGPIVFTTSGTLPGGLAVLTPYWPIKIDADTFYLATGRHNAFAGTRINITSAGSGTHTAKYRTTAAGIMERMRGMKIKSETLRASSDIDTV